MLKLKKFINWLTNKDSCEHIWEKQSEKYNGYKYESDYGIDLTVFDKFIVKSKCASCSKEKIEEILRLN